MTRSVNLLLSGVFVVVWAVCGCGPVKGDNVANNNNGNTNNNQNNNQNLPDASLADLVRFQGTVWSPGADMQQVLEVNRFPIPGAVVIANSGPPQDLPQEMYCNKCVEIPEHLPHMIADPVDGTFELPLVGGRTYWITVQKGEFRRVRQVQIPDMPGQVFSLETGQGQPRPIQTTLPNRTDLPNGDNIPKIAIIDGAYEDQRSMWEALGFDYDGFDIYGGFGNPVSSLTGDYNTLALYNLIVAPCGESFSGGEANIKQYVKDGGKLYIDDFQYDFAEQVWPEFLSFYVRGDGVCGDGGSTSWNVCNDWASAYDFIGTPDDQDFAGWIALPMVNGNNPIQLQAAWDSIYEMGEGEIGIDPETGTGPNGEVYAYPKVWMLGDTEAPGTLDPATVSWPFHCGRVLYTVYHTHSGSGGSGFNYELLLQEKIMMYLIMEIQTCSTGPVVE